MVRRSVVYEYRKDIIGPRRSTNHHRPLNRPAPGSSPLSFAVSSLERLVHTLRSGMMLSTLTRRRRSFLRHGVTRSLSSPAPQTANSGPPSEPTTPASVPPPQRLPTRHSVRRLPLVGTDASLRLELTRQILDAPQGSLFQYRNEQNSVSEAWSAAAEVVVPKAEYVLRGYAHTLSGTCWNRWLPERESRDVAMSDEQVQETLVTMRSILDRLRDEGYMYMQLRASRLEETQGPKVNAHAVSSEGEESDAENSKDGGTMAHARQIFDHVEALQDNIRKYAEEEGLMTDDDDDESSSSSSDSDSDDDQDDASDEPTYMDDFALPGPTTHMYDVLLDAMACQAHAPSVSAQETYLLWEDAIGRHKLDGGDAENTLTWTRPTVQTFNAAIRVAAALPYDVTDRLPSNDSYRDDSIHLAFSAFDVLSESQLVARNSATYTYLLQVVAKYFPASRSRGHIARGMLLHAREQGLLDAGLVAAYRAANEPNNGAEFDATLAMLDKPIRELPHKWRSNNRRLRSHVREATY